MQSLTFGNFQVGIVDNPSIEDKGGFEFASGMDIFSEPGVLKACAAMSEVTYGASASPADLPNFMVDTADGSGTRAYLTAGAKILESTDGTTFNLFRTNTQGSNLGLGIWNGYVVYVAATKLGRAPVGNGAAGNDSYGTVDSDTEYHPVLPQGGTLKIAAGRYIASLDESFTLTAQAMKLPAGYRVTSLADHFSRLFMGTRFGAATGAITVQDASIFDWRGTVLSSGSALPDNAYPLKMRGTLALLVDGRNLFAWPDLLRNVYQFDGIGFGLHRKLISDAISVVATSPGAVSQHLETVLFSGAFGQSAGVFQMKNGAICQAFVPSTITPGASETITIGMVKSTFNGVVYIGYFRGADSSYHIEKSGSNKQNNAFVRTLWHRAKSDNLKRWIGVKLNLKPLAANTSVAVSYRTTRDGSFTSAGSIDSTTQDKPLILAAQPRSREIQFKFTYTTSTSNTPELLTYDPLFEVLKTVR